jgi:hypothetical protein
MIDASYPDSSSAAVVDRDFSRDLKAVASQVRSSLSSLISSAGMDPQDPSVLNKRWGLNKTLSWKIAKVIQTDDAFLSLQQLPGGEGMDILLKKSRAAGVRSEFVDATKLAVDRFESLIKTHSGDRATFEMMAGEITPLGRQQREEQHRKLLFQGASYVWGVQARLFMNIRIVAPSALPGVVDVASAGGLLDFRRLRENVRWTLFQRRMYRDGTPLELGEFEPIDPVSAGQLVPLMPQFCSGSPDIVRMKKVGHAAVAELAPSRVGNAGAMSYIAGGIGRGIFGPRTAQSPFAHLPVICNTPSELLIYDLYIHQSLAHAIPPEMLLVRMDGDTPPNHAELADHQLPLIEPLLDTGSAATPPFTPEMPRYVELLNTVFARAKWSQGQFHGFRIKMAFPPPMSALVARYPLPKQPA